MEDGQIPDFRNVTDPEELRVLHVMTSRARYGLIITYSRNALTRSMSSRTPSIVNTEQRNGSTTPVAPPAFVHARGIFIVEPLARRIVSTTLFAWITSNSRPNSGWCRRVTSTRSGKF